MLGLDELDDVGVHAALARRRRRHLDRDAEDSGKAETAQFPGTGVTRGRRRRGATFKFSPTICVLLLECHSVSH